MSAGRTLPHASQQRCMDSFSLRKKVSAIGQSMPVGNGRDKYRNTGMEAGRYRGKRTAERERVKYEKNAYNVHTRHVHFPFEAPCGLHVTEVEVTDRWMSQPTPAPELVVVVTFAG